MNIKDALKEVLRNALIHDGLARGLREAVKALDKYVPCIKNYTKWEGCS